MYLLVAFRYAIPVVFVVFTSAVAVQVAGQVVVLIVLVVVLAVLVGGQVVVLLVLAVLVLTSDFSVSSSPVAWGSVMVMVSW